MVSRPEHPRWVVHAYVECRGRGGRWWLYSRPALSLDDHLAALLSGEAVDADDAAVHALGVPRDVSPAVLDEYTWRVAGPHAGEAGNIVSMRDANVWIARGASSAWPGSEAFARVTDPRWEHATWMSRPELEQVLSLYEAAAGQPAPATYCALHAMMRALERDYVVRLVLWFERLPLVMDRAASEPRPLLRDDSGELDRARGRVGATLRDDDAPRPHRS